MSIDTSQVGSGPGALVVLVPGLGLDARAWTLVRLLLTTPSLVIPLPTLGSPAGPGTDLTVEQQGRRLLAALPPGRRVILVGHSASCPVVVDTARRTSTVAGLVLIGPVTDPAAVSWPRMIARWLRTAIHEPLWELPVLAPQYRATGPRSMVRGLNHTRRYRTDTGLSALSVPTLIIAGRRDRIAPAPWCDQLARTVGTTVLSVPRAAHMVPLTDPQVIAHAVERLHSQVALGPPELAFRTAGGPTASAGQAISTGEYPQYEGE
jgi:pimeloyl-ACP methyl ester carboxylesterase